MLKWATVSRFRGTSTNMKIRTCLFWAHLFIGSVFGCFLFVIAATGAVLAYQRQILGWADRSVIVQPPSHGAQLLVVEELVRRASALEGTPPPTITIYSNPTAPVMFQMERFSVLYLNPYSGAVLGHGAAGTRAFFGRVEGVHRWFGAYGFLRKPARQLKFALNVGFLFLLVSGTVLWPPRSWTRKHLRAISWFRCSRTSHARNWNWHHAIGLWCALPLLVMSLTGLVLSYDWANNLVYQLARDKVPPPDHVFDRVGANRLIHSGFVWNSLMDRARLQVRGWRSITATVPDAVSAPIIFTIDTGDGGHPSQQSTLVLDAKSGRVLEWRPFQEKSTGEQLRELARWTHTGESLGLIGQTLAFIATCGTMLLVWTGFSLAIHRLQGNLARARRLPPGRSTRGESLPDHQHEAVESTSNS